MSETHWPVIVNDKDTPTLTLFVNEEGTMDLLSIERLQGGLIVISHREARALADVLKSVVEVEETKLEK